MGFIKKRKIKILGHRGVRSDPVLRENTLPAFNKGLNEADGVETDVVVSKDGITFLLHDSTIRFIPHLLSWVARASSRDIAQTNASDLDSNPLENGEAIPRLRDLFNLVAGRKDKIINIELKAPNVVQTVISEIHKAIDDGLISKDQIILSSFDHAQIAEARSIDPSIKRGLIFWQDSVRPCRLYPDSSNDFATCNPVGISNIQSEQTRKAAPDFFILPVHGLKRKYAEVVHDTYPDARFIVWSTVGEPIPENNRKLNEKLDDPVIEPLIEAVITDHPRKMKDFLDP